MDIFEICSTSPRRSRNFNDKDRKIFLSVFLRHWSVDFIAPFEDPQKFFLSFANPRNVWTYFAYHRAKNGPKLPLSGSVT